MIDAAAALAGRNPSDPFPPAALAKLFCGDGRPGVWGSTTYTGFAPYDDGHTALADLVNHRWLALPSMGDWPLVIYLAWPHKDEPALVQIIEGDVRLWVFPTRDALKAFARWLASVE